jgi:hypothetical protein
MGERRRDGTVGAKQVPMKVAIVVAAVVAALVVVVPSASEPANGSAHAVVTPPAAAFMPHGAFGPRQIVFFGYVKSVKRSGARYVMRVDPTLILAGSTAITAAVEDKFIRPGDGVPNDYYDVNERHRSFAYWLPATAHVTVLTNAGTGPRSTTVPVTEFAQIVKGRNPARRPGLWAPASGFWIRVSGDTALALDQAYRP